MPWQAKELKNVNTEEKQKKKMVKAKSKLVRQATDKAISQVSGSSPELKEAMESPALARKLTDLSEKRGPQLTSQKTT